MKNNYYKIILSFILLIFLATGCTQTGKKVKGFKHDTPLIKTDVKKNWKKINKKRWKIGPYSLWGRCKKIFKKKKKIFWKREK